MLVLTGMRRHKILTKQVSPHGDSKIIIFIPTGSPGEPALQQHPNCCFTHHTYSYTLIYAVSEMRIQYIGIPCRILPIGGVSV